MSELFLSFIVFLTHCYYSTLYKHASFESYNLQKNLYVSWSELNKKSFLFQTFLLKYS